MGYILNCSELTVGDTLEHITNVHVQHSFFWCGRHELAGFEVAKFQAAALILEE